MRNKWLLTLIIAILALPFFSSAVFAESEFADGVYEIGVEFIQENSDEVSMADNYVTKPVKLEVVNGKQFIEMEILSTNMVTSFVLEDGETKVISENSDENTKVIRFEVEGNLSEPVMMSMHVTVPGIYDTTHKARAVFDTSGVDLKTEIPEEEPEEGTTNPDEDTDSGEDTTEPETGKEEPGEGSEDDGQESGDAELELVPTDAYQINYVSDLNLDRYFDNPVTLFYKDGKTFIQLSGSMGQFIDSLTINGTEVTWGEINANGTYTVQLEHTGNLSEKLAFRMEISTPMGKMSHDAKLSFDESTKRLMVKPNEKTPVKGGDKVTLPNNDNLDLTLPEDLPEGVEMEINPNVKPSNHKGLHVAGEIYDFNFTGLEGYRGKFQLVMSYDEDSFNSDQVDIYYYDEVQGKWIAQNGKVENGKITIETDHFSIYGVFAKEANDDASGGDGEEGNTSNDQNEQNRPGQGNVEQNPKNEQLKPDKAYEIDYDIKQMDGVTDSVSNDFFLKPAFLFEKDGKKYIQITIKNSNMIKQLRNQYGDVLIVKENKEANTIVVQFRVPDDLSNMRLDMHIVVPAMPGFPGYDMKHEALIVFYQDSMKNIQVGDHLLAGTNDSDNLNGTSVSELEKSAPSLSRDRNSDDEDSNNSTGLDPNTPSKPELGEGEEDTSAAASNAGNGGGLNPKTGEETNILLYVLLLIGSAIPLAVKAKRHFA